MLMNEKVTFIGSGNLAWHLAPAFDNAGWAVHEVFSRHAKNAQALTDRLYQAEVKTTLDFANSSSSIFVICVSDNAIQGIAQEIILPEESILIHTSGSKSLKELDFAATDKTAVFYPLQTFSKEKKLDFRTVPVFIECADPVTEKILFRIAKEIGSKAEKITSEKRMALHVAAVFASNFTNHMVTIAQEVARDNQLDFNLLKPLITESITKSLSLGPNKAQTGPAVRGDLETLDKHFEFLQEDEALARIYKVISQHIIDHYSSE